jgi:hypothetical protein
MASRSGSGENRWSVPGRKAVRFVVVRILTLGGFVAGPEPAGGQGLAFVRFMYNQGLEQAGHPQSLATTALLSFHDAAEMFLGLAAVHLGVNPSPAVNFDGYFAEIKKGVGVDLPSRYPMQRMNRSRVNLMRSYWLPDNFTIISLPVSHVPIVYFLPYQISCMTHAVSLQCCEGRGLGNHEWPRSLSRG